MQSIIISLIVLMLGASSALADVVTKCNSPQGYSYFIAGAAIPKKEAGWAPDRISKGSYIHTHDADGTYDIIFQMP